MSWGCDEKGQLALYLNLRAWVRPPGLLMLVIIVIQNNSNRSNSGNNGKNSNNNNRVIIMHTMQIESQTRPPCSSARASP